MTRIRNVGGSITKTTGGDHNIYSKKNIVENSLGVNSETSEAGRINFGSPKTYTPKTDLKITKVEGPFDENDKVVKVVNKGVFYTYKATASRKPTEIELKLLKWATKNDDGKIKDLNGVSSNNIISKDNEKTILIGIAINEDCDKARVYAYFKKAIEEVSVGFEVNNTYYKFNPLSYAKGNYSRLLNSSYIRREAWGANEPLTNSDRSFEPYCLVAKNTGLDTQDRQAIPELSKIYFGIAIHHSGNNGIDTMTKVQDEHVNGKNKFADVGYHFGIDLSGKVYEGRFIGVKGSHLTKYNTGVIGIVFLADFDHQWWDSDNDMTHAALVSVITLIKALKEQFPNINVLGGHKEFKNNVGERSCPGEYGLDFVKALRTELKIKSPKEMGHG